MQSFTSPKWIIHLNDKLINYNNILVLTSQGFRARGQLNLLENLLSNKNFYILDNIDPLPTINNIDLQYKLLNKSNFEFELVVALGGGSVIDTAKCIAYLLATKTLESLSSIIQSAKNNISVRALPIIAIPTTAGTGSEATSFATVWDSDFKLKRSLEDSSIKPIFYIHDFNLLKTLNGNNFLFPLLDAVAHSLESIWNTSATESSIQIALEALELLIPNLSSNSVMYSDSTLSQVQKGSFLAGEAIEITRTSISHSISYPITSYFGVPHGLAASFTLPKILEFYLQRNAEGRIDVNLLKSAREALLELNLNKMLDPYCTYQELISLVPKMYHSGRADKFITKVDQTLIKNFLK